MEPLGMEAGHMELRILRTKKDHAQALAEVERLIALDPARGTPGGDALEVLSILVERYEKEHYSIDAPTPVEAIEFRMDQMGLRQADLVPYFGSRSRASEVLSGKRALTVGMIRALHDGLGIPLEALVGGDTPRRKRVKKRTSVKRKADITRKKAARRK
jgi:HTH-type transcriptional regulator/antitoxin HigA